MTMQAKFPGTCTKCNARFTVGTRIDWAPGVGAAHADRNDCARPVALAKPEPPKANGAPIAAFLHAARDRGIKFPKVRFLGPSNRELRLSLAGSTSRVPGAVQVKLDSNWVGRVNPDGTVVGLDSTLRTLIDVIAVDPAKAAKEYGALMSRCSFCGKSLTDEGSVEVGYGAVCARNFNLPHKHKGTPTVRTPVAA